MNPDRPRLQERIFGFLAEKATARPWRAVTISIVLLIASIGLAAWRLELKTSNLDLVDPNQPVVARFRDFARTFGTPNMLVVVLEGEDGTKLRAATDRTAEKIREAHGARAVFARLPYNPLS